MYAILFQNHINNINGALIDIIEYYLSILEYNKDIKLLIINYNSKFKEIVENLIEDRYFVEDINFKKNIQNINKIDLIRIKFDKILITDYSTIKTVKGLINLRNNKSKIIILSDLHTDNNDYVINKSLYYNSCVNYYGEMPFVYKDFQYKHKFLFDRFKTLNKIESNIFLHSPENKDYNFINNLNLPNKTIIYKTHQHKNNLFELFDTFVYYHANKWFDPRPRLMHECFYYNKEIIYYNVFNIKDGSYYRYNDLIINGLKDRVLTKNDKIVSEFI